MKLTLYFTLGYPDNEVLDEFLEVASENGVERVELGFPSADPRYDGPMIKRTHEVAMGNYADQATKNIVKRLNSCGIKAYALVYLNSVMKSLDSFLEKISSFGFDGIILPDLLIDYFSGMNQILSALKEQGINIIPFVTPSTPDAVARYVISEAGKWIYYGLLPSTGITVPYSLKELYGRAREIIGSKEICFGFGLRNIPQIRELNELGADSIAIGSKLLEFLEQRNTGGFKAFLEEVNVARN